MHKYLLALLLPLSCFGQNFVDYRDFVAKYEGYKNVPYAEKNTMVVGIGHSLTAHKNIIKNKYTDEEINKFFESDLTDALNCAQKNIDGFNRLPSNVRLVVVCLIFNVGPTGFSKFHNFIAALDEGDFQIAAVFLDESKWHEQVSYSKYEDFYYMILNSRR